LPLPGGIGPDHGGVHREAFTTHQSGIDTALQDLLEYEPKSLGFAEAAMAVLGEGGMIRYRVFDARTTEWAIYATIQILAIIRSQTACPVGDLTC
jgi:hypothetical protein